MKDLAAITEPPEIRLLRGAMQNWSDFGLGSVADSLVVRRLLLERSRAEQSFLLAGAHVLDLVAGLAQEQSQLTVLTRSIPDATSIAEAVAGEGPVEVLCGSLTDLVEQERTFDLVVALDDFTRLVSIEDWSSTWEMVLAHLSSLVAEGGRLLVGVENELGLHHLHSPRSRKADNTDADWDVLAAHDDSRPRSEAQLVARVVAEGLAVNRIYSVFPSWLNASLVVSGQLDDHASRLLGLLSMRSPHLRRGWADPSRIVRAANAAGYLRVLASGWLVDAARGITVDSSDRPLIVEETSIGAVSYSSAASGVLIRQSAEGRATIRVPAGATLLSELFIDACASHRLPDIRALLNDYAAWVSRNEARGCLPRYMSLAGFENVVRAEEEFLVLTPGTTSVAGTDRLWATLGELAAMLRDRGVRHPWPAFTSDKQLVLILAAMTGLPVEGDLDPSLIPPRPLELPAASLDPAGLLASVQRLEESNAALRSRSEWFQRRLDERERELRLINARHHAEVTSEQSVQEALREEIAALRASRSYRIGQFLLSPAVRARDLARTRRDEQLRSPNP